MDELKKAIEALKGHFDATIAEVKGLVGKQDEEIKAQGSSSAETAKSLTEAAARLDTVNAELAAATKRLDEMEAASKRLGPGGGSPDDDSPGAKVVNAEGFKSLAAVAPSGQKIGGESFAVGSFWPKARKQLTGASLGDFPAYLYPTERVPGIVVAPELMPRVRDLFPQVPITVGASEFVRETAFNNSADMVAEGAEKPESSLEFEVKQTVVRTIAHWLAATRQILADAAGLQQFIDVRLRYGLALVEDWQLLWGTGVGNDIAGALTDPAVQLYTQAAGENLADAIRQAMNLVFLAGYQPTGIVLHPTDYTSVEIMKDAIGRYIWVNVPTGGGQVLWRLPVVQTQAMIQGNFAVGAFALAAAIRTREDAMVRISDQHEDFFTRNLLAILAEERLALEVYRPQAICLGTFTAASSA